MALIGTIRKNFWFVLILLGFALVAFLFMDIFGNQSIGTSASGPAMGEVAGETISYNDFRRAESALYKGSSANQFVIQNSLWDFFVEKALVNKEASALGVDVSKEELRDLEFGANLHPLIQQNFRNPQTGQVDMAQLNEIKNAIDNDEFTNTDFRAYWAEQEKQIVKDQKQAKLNAMVSKAMFTPTWMVNKLGSQSSANASFEYVKVPFDYIPDTDVDVSDAAISSYLKSNSAKYTNDKETRRAEYVVFNVVATAADSMLNKDALNVKIAEFKTTQSDSIFAANNNGSYVNYYAKSSEMPANLQEVVGGMNNGDVYGPYIDNGFYTAFKLIDKRSVPDSVKASHILRQFAPTDLAGKDAANALVDSLMTELKAGRAKFSDLAEEFSQDPGSASKGGDLGYFTQGSMLPEFNQACFFGPEGGYQKVATRAGIHIINVRDQKYIDRETKYKTAIIRVPITPSQDTQDALYSDVTDLVSQNKTIDALKTAVAAKGLSTEFSAFVNQNDFTVGTLGSEQTSRDIVKWLFDSDTDAGEVSAEVYEYSDPNLYYDNKYVAVALNAVSPAGLLSVDAARDQAEFLVKNQLKGEKIAAQVSAGALSDIASKFGQTVQSVAAANMASTNITGLGNEPKVIAAAMNGELNANSGAIVGNSGVYIIKPTNRTEGTAANVPALRSSTNAASRTRVTTGLINSIRKNAKIEDSRLALDM